MPSTCRNIDRNNAGVVHGDVKCENILVDLTNNELKLIYFGNALTLKEGPYDSFAGTEVYYPPGWFKSNIFHPHSGTVWALGITIYCMECGDIPFQNPRQIEAARLNFPKFLSVDVRDLILNCLQMKPTNRLSLGEILKHPWIVQYNWTK